MVEQIHFRFVDQIDVWWQGGLRRYENSSIQATDMRSQTDYISHNRTDPIETSYNDAISALQMSIDYFKGALDVVLSDSLFSSFALARSSLEAAARSYWLLDPSIDQKVRLCRCALYRAWYLSERQKAAKETASPEHASQLATRIRELYEWALYYKLTKLDDRRKFVRGSKGFTDLVKELIAELPEGADTETLVYRWLSGIAHSNPLAILEFRLSDPTSRYQQREGQSVQVQIGADARTAFQPIWWSARGIQAVLKRRAAVAGWESPDPFLLPVLEELRGLCFT